MCRLLYIISSLHFVVTVLEGFVYFRPRGALTLIAG